MLPVPTSGSNDWARAGVAMKIRTATVVRTLFIPFSYSTLLGAHIAFPDARPSCCCESRWQRRTFAFNSPHLTTDRRVQHPTLNDRSATHVFVAAIGTTAFLRFRECSHAEWAAIVWAVIVHFGSKADICSANSHVRFTPESGHLIADTGCLLCANSGHSHAARSTRVSISPRSIPKSIGLVRSASAPFSKALRLVSASP